MASYKVCWTNILFVGLKFIFFSATHAMTIPECDMFDNLKVFYNMCQMNTSLACNQQLHFSPCLIYKPLVKTSARLFNYESMYLLLMFDAGFDDEDRFHIAWVEQNISGSHFDPQTQDAPSGTPIIAYNLPSDWSGVHHYIIHVAEQVRHIPDSISASFQQKTNFSGLVEVLEVLSMHYVNHIEGSFQFLINTTSSVSPTTSTASLTTSTVSPTTRTVSPTTSTASPTTSTASPTTSTASPTTSSLSPTTSTASPTTSTVSPTTITASPTTSTASPTITTASSTTTVQQVATRAEIESTVSTERPVEDEKFGVAGKEEKSDHEQLSFLLWLIPVLAVAGLMKTGIVLWKLQAKGDKYQTGDSDVINAEPSQVTTQDTVDSSVSEVTVVKLPSSVSTVTAATGKTGASVASDLTAGSLASDVTAESLASDVTAESLASDVTTESLASHVTGESLV